MKGKRVVVTGGAGFIGSHIAKELVDRDAEVTIIDNLSYGSEKNIADIKDKVRFVKGDIRDYDLLRKEFQDVDYVSHQAALRSVPLSVEKPEEFNDVNISGHFNVLKAAYDCDVKRVVFASSSSIYGETNKLPQSETDLPKPVSPYAITKLMGEYYCTYFFKQFGLEAVSLRYFNVFGPRQDPNSHYAAVIPIFINQIINDQPPLVHGDGLQSRDFTYVYNNVIANILAFDAKGVGGEVINISDGTSITVLELISKINSILGKDIEPDFTVSRPGDIKKTRGDTTKSNRLLGYETKVKFEEGLKKTVEWFQDQAKLKKRSTTKQVLTYQKF